MRLSKRALEALTSDQAPPQDKRPAELARLTTVSGDVMDALQEVFAGTALLSDHKRVEALLTTRAEIHSAWGAAAKSFVMVGRRLLELDEQLASPEERVALKAGCERLFPFSEPVGSKLRAVARAVDSGVLSLETCPASYSVAYEITLLKPPLLEEARRRGLITPRVTRAVLIAFRKAHETKPEMQIDVPALMAEQRRIRTRLSRLDEERRGLETRQAEIARILEAAGETG
jgi:hypothetical protein